MENIMKQSKNLSEKSLDKNVVINSNEEIKSQKKQRNISEPKD